MCVIEGVERERGGGGEAVFARSKLAWLGMLN